MSPACPYPPVPSCGAWLRSISGSTPVHEPPAQLDDAFAVRAARVAELEHAQPARRAQVRLGRGDDALAQRSAERHSALGTLRVEFGAAAARHDAVPVTLLPIGRAPFVARQAASGH